MKNKNQGQFAELLARIILVLKGYKILEKNYVVGRGTTAGEVDIIARKKNALIFVEVKKRKNLEDALYAISKSQQKRIINAAKIYMSKGYYSKYYARFDAILIEFPFKIKHIKNAWTL